VRSVPPGGGIILFSCHPAGYLLPQTHPAPPACSPPKPSAASTPAATFSSAIPLPPLAEQERIVAELDAEAARIEAVRGLIPSFEAKIQRVLARVWGEA
jgi:hypothetical protein